MLFFLSPLPLSSSSLSVCSGRVKFSQFALGSQPCGLLRMEKNIIVGCMDSTLNCYSQKVTWKPLSCDPLSSRLCGNVCVCICILILLCREGEYGVCDCLMSSLLWSSWTTGLETSKQVSTLSLCLIVVSNEYIWSDVHSGLREQVQTISLFVWTLQAS